MLKLKLFGSGQVIYGDQTLAGFPRHQGELLLCFLLLHRHKSFTREVLATLFWGDLGSGAARKYLRDAVWRLRRALQTIGVPVETYLISEGQWLGFNAASAHELDIDCFERALAPYRHIPGEALTAEQVRTLTMAIELYSGDLLDGLYCDWLLAPREYLRQLYLIGLDKLVAYHEREGAFGQALHFCQAMLAVDNFMEQVHQRMMTFYWRLGNREAALAQYRHCRQILQAELEVSPTPQTDQLYQQLLAAQHPASLPGRQYGGASPAQATIQDAFAQIAHLRLTLAEAHGTLNMLETRLSELLANPDPGTPQPNADRAGPTLARAGNGRITANQQ